MPRRFLHEIATTTAQPFARNERYGCGVPLAGSVRTGLAMTRTGVPA